MKDKQLRVDAVDGGSGRGGNLTITEIRFDRGKPISMGASGTVDLSLSTYNLRHRFALERGEVEELHTWLGKWLSETPEKEGDMKTYIVYVDGNELPKDKWIKAAGHNQAEKKAKALYPGRDVSVAYTEVWP